MKSYLTGLIDFPLSQPYSGLPWSYSGTENAASLPPNVVDWVLIELHDAASAALANAATNIARQAAFILNDGSVVGLDGISNLLFTNAISQNLFVVVWHRNHLPVLSAIPLLKTAGVYSYDFTIGSGQAYGFNAQKLLDVGMYGMLGGDVNADGLVDDTDKMVSWQSEAGQYGNLPSDINLDGQSDNQDKNRIWFSNLGEGSQLP